MKEILHIIHHLILIITNFNNKEIVNSIDFFIKMIIFFFVLKNTSNLNINSYEKYINSIRENNIIYKVIINSKGDLFSCSWDGRIKIWNYKYLYNYYEIL